MSLLIVLVIWRLLLFLVAYWSQITYAFTPMFPYSDIFFFPSGLPRFIWSFANFDGVHYLTIAQKGYFAQYTQAFFPLYPFVVRIASLFFGDSKFILVGLSVSFISFVAAVIFFRKLLLLDYKKNLVQEILLILLVFPTSFYFAALYSESLFFLFVILSFWFARKKKWILSGLIAMLASATRISGIFLLFSLITEWFVIEYKITSWRLFKKNIPSLLKSLIKFPPLYIVPLGLLGYMLFLKINFNDPLYFWHAQAAFGAERSIGIVLPPQVVWRYIKILTRVVLFSYPFWYALWELGAYILGVILMYIGHRQKIRLSYLLFGWFIILVPALTGTFSSMPRYLILAFPLYIVLGRVKNKFIFLSIVCISLAVLIFFTSNFTRGLWVA